MVSVSRVGADLIRRVTRRKGRQVMGKTRKATWQDHHDGASFTEESVWQAIADAEGLDYSEIADGDLVDWL